MERQRVVHFARNKTARVLGPGFTNRQGAPQTTSELSQAPLASIDSDFVVITKRRDETNMAPNLWEQIRQSMPPTNVQPINDESILLEPDGFYNNQNNFAPPRTYVRQRSTQNIDLQVDCTCPGQDQKLKSLEVQQHDLRGHSTANSDSRIRLAQSSGKPSLVCINDTQSALIDVTKCQIHYSNMQKQSHGTENGKPREVLSLINRNTYGNTKSKSSTTSSTCVQITPSPSKTFHTSHVRHLSRPASTFKHGSEPRLPSTLDEQPRHRANQVESSSNSTAKQLNVFSQANSKQVENVGKSGQNLRQPIALSEQDQSQRETSGSQISGKGTNCSVMLPDSVFPFEYFENDEEHIPEEYNVSPSAYTSNIRLISERIVRSHTIHTSEVKNNSNGHPVCINTRLCSSVQTARKNDHKPHVHKGSLDKHIMNQTTGHPGHSDSNDVDQRRKHPDKSTDYIPEPESNLCEKRNTLKLTNHGYSSISDLEGPFKHLSLETSDFTGSKRLFNSRLDSHNEVRSKNTCSNGQEGAVTQTEMSCTNGTSVTIKSINNCEESSKCNDSSVLRQSMRSLDRDVVKQLSFRLASTGTCDVWLLEQDTHPLRERSAVNRKTSKISDPVCHYENMQNTIDEILVKDLEKDSGTTISGGTCQQTLTNHNHEEVLWKLKRRSFMLATRSLSDLSFPDEDVHDNPALGSHLEIRGPRAFRNVSDHSANSSVFNTPDSQIRRLRGDSFSSGRLNSSFGSFYSCQSHDSAKNQLSQNISADINKHHSKQNKSQRDSPVTCGRRTFGDSVDSDSSVSGDTSVYYTASDNSFRQSEQSANNVSGMNYIIQQSSIPLLADQWRRNRSNIQQNRPKCHSSNTLPHSVNALAHSSNTLPRRRKLPKHPNPISARQCYGCGFDKGLAVQTHRRGRRHNIRGVPSKSRIWVNPEYMHGLHEDRKRSQSLPATRRVQTKRTDVSPKHEFPVHTQTHSETNVLPHTTPPHSGDVCSSISGSLTSLFLDSPWQAMPRIPPSLGRPRRKLYAGFDSQPLPMDNFLSDSSSVYSTQSCSSWGTSRSATVESSSRPLDMSSKAHSISSISSILVTPTRHVSQDDVFDFFTYTDKRSSVCENKHNLYLSSHNSFADDCLNGSLYDKTYSKDSLESFLSDGTTVNIEQNLSTDNSLEYVKPRLNSAPDDTYFHNNNGAVLGNGKELNEKRSPHRLNNSCESEIGSRSHNNTNVLKSAKLAKSHNQLKPLKASSSTSLPRAKFLSKRKYYSSKDILDLVMMSEKNYKGSKRRSRSLERQAQKMCEVILCLN